MWTLRQTNRGFHEERTLEIFSILLFLVASTMISKHVSVDAFKNVWFQIKNNKQWICVDRSINIKQIFVTLVESKLLFNFPVI